MSSRSNDTRGKQEEQDWSDQEWEELVKEGLPGDLEEKAIIFRAWSRKREVSSIGDLLRALLVYAAWGYSFQMLAVWATLKGVANMSETAWRKRFLQSAAWIDWLLRALLKGVQPQGSCQSIEQKQRRIMLIDATRLKTVGGTGDDLRLHWAYNLLGARTEQVEISDHHDAESLRHFRLQTGDIAVLDAGYPVPTTVQEAKQQGIDVVLRAAASNLRLESEKGKVIQLKEHLKQQLHGVTRRVKALVKTKDGKRHEVSLIAHRLPKELAQKASERKRKHLQAKRGKHFNQELVWWAEWVLLISTLDEKQWTDAEVLRLYRARWQIELIFKRFKQILDVHRIEIKDWARARIVAQLYLIVWLLQEGVQNWLREQWLSVCEPRMQPCSFEQEGQSIIVSSWRFTSLSLQQVQIVLRGTWTTPHLLRCMNQLRRYLLVRPRHKRPHQQTCFQAWLSGKLGAFFALPAP